MAHCELAITAAAEQEGKLIFQEDGVLGINFEDTIDLQSESVLGTTSA